MQTQVTIVGGGPVGLGLAIELGRRGIRCTVVERRVDPQRIPKGQNLTQRTMEHFRAWGAEEALRAARPIPPSFGIGGLTAYGSLLSGYAYDWLQREIVRPYYAADNERLPQYETERVLRERAAGFDAIDLRLGWQLDSVSAADDRVTARITRVTSGVTTGGDGEVVESDYLVGCDGSRSAVREAVGIDQALSDHDRLMVLLVFRSRGLDELLRERFPGKSYFSVLHPELQGYWRFFGRVDLAPTWFFHAPVPRGTTEHNTDFRRLLHEAAGAEFDVEFRHIGYWDLRFAIAKRYASGRVMLAGDAAHSHPPYGGYGVNTGFEDARNLGWKLAAAAQGWAGPGLLPSYDAERRPVFESTARDFIEKSIFADRDFLARFNPAHDREAFEREWAARATGARNEVGSFEPHYEGSPIVAAAGAGAAGAAGAAASPSALGSHQVRARAGHHLTPLRLDATRGVYDALSDDFSLLAIGADESLVSGFEDAARRLGLPLSIVRSSPAGDCARYEAPLVLVRPDHFVAWCGRGEGSVDPVAVLQRAVGA
jgi:2-polyprenyl-6-methoxyphenol hydroxylase-like FAD-dependent oxidoreductase